MATLENAVAGAVATAQGVSAASTTVTELAALMGGNPALAMALAGTTNKKSAEYKAALRNVQRYKKREAQAEGEGRSPRKLAGNLNEIAKKEARRGTGEEIKRRGATVNLAGVVLVSPGSRKEDYRERDIRGVFIRPEYMAPVIDALAAGDTTGAADAFQEAFLSEWAALGNAVIPDSESLSIEMTVGFHNVNYSQGASMAVNAKLYRLNSRDNGKRR